MTHDKGPLWNSRLIRETLPWINLVNHISFQEQYLEQVIGISNQVQLWSWLTLITHWWRETRNQGEPFFTFPPSGSRDCWLLWQPGFLPWCFSALVLFNLYSSGRCVVFSFLPQAVPLKGSLFSSRDHMAESLASCFRQQLLTATDWIIRSFTFLGFSYVWSLLV